MKERDKTDGFNRHFPKLGDGMAYRHDGHLVPIQGNRGDVQRLCKRHWIQHSHADHV